MFNKKALASAVAASLLGLASSAQAALIIDLDGLGGAGTIVQADVFDWLPGNALSLDGNNYAAASGGIGSSFDFTTYSQANLSTLVLGGVVQASPNWSYVSGFGETAIVTGLNSIQLFLDPDNPVNFFEIWAGGDVGNDLLGTGFNDGTLILSGYVTSATGSFSLQIKEDLSLTDPVLLDAFGIDDWDGQLTQPGTGGSTINVTVGIGYLNPDYFLNAAGALSIFQTQQNLPFDTANPAECFVTQAGGATQCDNVFNLTSDTAAGLGGYNPILGEINAGQGPGNCSGDPENPGVCDTIFLADASMTLQGVSIPEPATLALFGAGLLGFGAARRRSKQK